MALIQYAQKGKKTPILRTLYDLMVKSTPETGLNIIRKMYVDTGLTSGPAALKALKEFPGPSQIVFCSDFPFAKVAPIVAKNLSRDGDFTEAELKAIFHGNCQKLFPQFSITGSEALGNSDCYFYQEDHDGSRAIARALRLLIGPAQQDVRSDPLSAGVSSKRIRM